MIRVVEDMAFYCKFKIDSWFQRVFKEQAGGAELVATLLIVGVVLALALVFRKQLIGMVSGLWNTFVAGGNAADQNTTYTIDQWGN